MMLALLGFAVFCFLAGAFVGLWWAEEERRAHREVE